MLRTLSFSIAIAAALASCERAPRTTQIPEDVTVQTPPQGTVLVSQPNACAFAGPPMNESQCECVGGTPRADLGDGHAMCEPGEHELARIRYGIEHGICCQPVVPLPVQPLALGVRGRQPATAIAEPYRGAAQNQPVKKRFHGEIGTSLQD